MILTYLCKIHNGVVFFVGSPDVMRPDKDKDKLYFIMLNLFYDISSCPYDMSILNYVLIYAIVFFL